MPRWRRSPVQWTAEFPSLPRCPEAYLALQALLDVAAAAGAPRGPLTREQASVDALAAYIGAHPNTALHAALDIGLRLLATAGVTRTEEGATEVALNWPFDPSIDPSGRSRQQRFKASRKRVVTPGNGATSSSEVTPANRYPNEPAEAPVTPANGRSREVGGRGEESPRRLSSPPSPPHTPSSGLVTGGNGVTEASEKSDDDVVAELRDLTSAEVGVIAVSDDETPQRRRVAARLLKTWAKFGRTR